MALVTDIRALALPEIIQNYCHSRPTARLTVSFPEADGIFFFTNGELVDAHLGELRGTEAVRCALRMGEGDFRIDLDVPSAPRTINQLWNHLSADTAPQAETELSPTESGTIAHNKAMKVAAITSPANENDSVRVNAASGSASASLQQLLLNSGVVQDGVVVDGYGVTVCEIGHETDHEEVSRRAFLISGLESLINAEFELGESEGILLESDGQTKLMVSEGNFSCVFTPPGRLPATQAFSEVRRVLAGGADLAEGEEQ